MSSQVARQEAIRRMFLLLEQKYGGRQGLIDNSHVETATSLSTNLLKDLFEHRLTALRVPNFVPKATCDRLSSHLLSHPSTVNWNVSSGQRGLQKSDVLSIGTPYNVAVGQGKEAVERYFQEAIPLMREARTICGGASPMDQLRLELDELWPSGCSVAKNRQGRSMLGGIGRITKPAAQLSDGFCHVDELGPFSTKRGLFGANIYLKVPEDGGHVQIWNIKINSRWDFYRNAHTLSKLLIQDPEAQQQLRQWLPEPTVVKPEVGDLIIICAQRPHAVSRFTLGHRVSYNAFLQHEQGKPLLLDS
eukprot:GILK01009856.1.p1 GENE.GILK01009856.1~~GILK01009856.1.p1  ORF type:complete len:304 (-),score=27.85 GILK01009856.1:129-1040(-)